MDQKVFGLVGWSGSGKTTLVTTLLPELTGRGLTVSTVKHTHHDIEIDKPGKDSFRHRKAGATEVLITSPVRWALVRELRDTPEPDMVELIGRMGPVDLILVEGFKSHPYPKLEVHRPSTGKTLLAENDQTVVAVASDETVPGLAVPLLKLSDMGAIANFIVEHCQLEPVRKDGTNT
ncbi:MAG: molybdopterin-guanine dinucleotide biosynthesis protein B [Rhodospirillales bacterium]|nr:molybdopterin-guanine dinucleotide biosynthesis protein B [Rhodospirillales bacterium]